MTIASLPGTDIQTIEQLQEIASKFGLVLKSKTATSSVEKKIKNLPAEVQDETRKLVEDRVKTLSQMDGLKKHRNEINNRLTEVGYFQNKKTTKKEPKIVPVPKKKK